MLNPYSRYFLAGELTLPHSTRVYFDWQAHEWNNCSAAQKLLDLGFVTAMGYNIAKDIKDILANHPYIGEHAIKSSLSRLMAEMTGGNWALISIEYQKRSLKRMIDDFRVELLGRYRLPNDESKHYIIPYDRPLDNDEVMEHLKSLKQKRHNKRKYNVSNN